MTPHCVSVSTDIKPLVFGWYFCQNLRFQCTWRIIISGIIVITAMMEKSTQKRCFDCSTMAFSIKTNTNNPFMSHGNFLFILSFIAYIPVMELYVAIGTDS